MIQITGEEEQEKRIKKAKHEQNKTDKLQKRVNSFCISQKKIHTKYSGEH